MADIQVGKPESGTQVTVGAQPDAKFVFDFAAGDTKPEKVGGNLELNFDDGSKITFENFYTTYNEENPVNFNVNGVDVSSADFFAALNEPDLNPAAGPAAPAATTPQNGGRYRDYTNAALGTGLDHLTRLDYNSDRGFEWDDAGWITGPGDDGYLLGMNAANAGGAGRGNNPVSIVPEHPWTPDPNIPNLPGDPHDPYNPYDPSNPGAGLDPNAPRSAVRVHEKNIGTADGVQEESFIITAPDGVATISIGNQTVYENGRLVPLADRTFHTDEGELTITGFDAATGKLTYNFKITSASAEHSQQGEDSISHSFKVNVTDTDGDSASGYITVIVDDDIAEAADDTASVTEGDTTPITGNVLDNDSFGADGKNHTSYVKLDSDAEGEYGTLTLNPDGSYSFALNNDNPAIKALKDGDTLEQKFNYTITDQDGDTSSATLTITINGVNNPVTVTPHIPVPIDPTIPDPTDEEEPTDPTDPTDPTEPTDPTDPGKLVSDRLVVKESDLGGDKPVTVDGAMDITAPDGVASIVIADVIVWENGELVRGAEVRTDEGVLNNFAFDPATGKLTYTYTLEHATDEHKVEGGDEKIAHNLTVTVTDVDGDSGSSTITIVVEDDTPKANDDRNTIFEDDEDGKVEGNVLLGDDFGGVADKTGADGLDEVDGKTVTLIGSIEGTYGTLTLQPDGSYTYTRNDKGIPEGDAKDVFTYKIVDKDGDESEATLTIDLKNVKPEPTTPGKTDEEDGDPENNTGAIDLAMNDDGKYEDSMTADLFKGPEKFESAKFVNPDNIVVDGAAGDYKWAQTADNTLVGTGPNGAEITVTLVGIDEFGNVTIKTSMNAAAQHAEGDGNIKISGITVEATDKGGSTAENPNVTITIEDATPEAKDDNATINEGAKSISGDVFLGDDHGGVADIQGADGVDNTVTLIGDGKGQFGELVLDPDGKYTYELYDWVNLDKDQTKTETFQYTITDKDGDPSTATLTITIKDKGPTETTTETGDKTSLDLILEDVKTKGGTESSDERNADLFDSPQDITKVWFIDPDNMNIQVEGAADRNAMARGPVANSPYTWDVSEDHQTLIGTGPNGAEITVTITGFKPDGSVSIKASMNEAAKHAEGSEQIKISGLTVAAEDAGGTTGTNSNVTITVVDAGPAVPDIGNMTYTTSEQTYAQANFMGKYAETLGDGEYAKPSTTLDGEYGKGYWVGQFMDNNYYTGKGATDKTLGNYDAFVNSIYICPTMAQYEFGEDGTLISVKDINNTHYDYRDKNFYLTNKGLTVGAGANNKNTDYQTSDYVWNEQEVGFVNSDNNKGQFYTDTKGNVYPLTSANMAEAIMIEAPLNSVAYGITIKLGSIEPGDKIVLTFMFAPQHSELNHIVHTEIFAPTEDQIDNGTYIHNLKLPDGFTKVLVSPLPSADPDHNSGFTLQEVEFKKPVYEASSASTVIDPGVDGLGSLVWNFDENHWDKNPTDGSYTTNIHITEGLYKGNYEVHITIDDNGVMKGTIWLDPKDNSPNPAKIEKTLFEGKFNNETGEWKLSQYFNFEFANGSKKITGTLTITDSDGDSQSSTVNIPLADKPLERFDQVSTGTYNPTWQSTESLDTASDFMAGEDIHNLMYAKGGNDIVSGDGGKEAFGAVLDDLNLDTTTKTNILKDLNGEFKDVNATRNAYADKVYNAIDANPADFAAKLDNREAQHKNEWDGSDALYGGNGNDVLIGWGGDDYLSGDAGNDYIFAGGGNDIIVYDADDKYIDGGEGFNILLANKGTTLTELTNVNRCQMLLRYEGEGDIKKLNLTTLSALENYGIIIGAAGGVTLVDMPEHGIWHDNNDGTFTLMDGDDSVLTVEVTGGFSIVKETGDDGQSAQISLLSDEEPIPVDDFDMDQDDGQVLPTALDTEFSSVQPKFLLASTSHQSDADVNRGPSIENDQDANIGKSIIGSNDDETLSGTDGDDFIDGLGGADTILAGEGNDLIVYDSSDYLIDGGDGIDFLLASAGDETLDTLLKNGSADGTIVRDVEVMLKGIDSTGLQNMGELASKYGFSFGKDANGNETLMLDGSKWAAKDGIDGASTTTYGFKGDESITLETSLQFSAQDEATNTITLVLQHGDQ